MRSAFATLRDSGRAMAEIPHRHTVGEEAFHRMISIELRRTERSRKSLLLMLLEIDEHTNSTTQRLTLEHILKTLAATLRETDVSGWYKQDQIVGVMFTEIVLEEDGSVPNTLMTRVNEALKNRLTPQQFRQLAISSHSFPEAQPIAVPEKSYPAAFRISPASGAAETAV